MQDVLPPSRPTGLTRDEVAERIARGAVNRVRRSDGAEYADIVVRNVFTLFNALVAPAAVVLFALGDYKPALTVSGMAFTNLVLGLVQEMRAKRHLDRLTLLAEGKARVLREGAVCEIASGDVVEGDHVLIAAGDSIVADGAVLEARFLEVDEALLTGESDPVPRKPGDRVLSGSFCVAGEGAFRADRVGAASFAQKTAAEAKAYRYSHSPLQKSINLLIQLLTIVAVLLCLGYLGRYFAHGHSDIESRKALVRMIAATITSMVPAGLVLMATLAFVLGAVRMTARGALVNRLNAVESMASIDTLCMDKTGTLTTNQLQLAQVRILSGGAEEVSRLLRLFACCSLDQSSKTLAALRAALGEEKAELVDQLPFKSQNRYSAVRVRSETGEYTLALGACESLRPFLAAQGDWETVWKEMLAGGLRLLLFAQAEASPPRSTFDGSLEGFTLKPLALVALSDEVRPEAAAVLRHLAGQGISFKILSGDNPETVRATVAPLGHGESAAALAALASAGVVSGAELEVAGNPDELIRAKTVFGRVSPWQKVQIVRTLKAQGRQVAMVGDGVNDVLPIKNADLGIAMGAGSRASKTVAGIVLETNDFALLPQTLDEGRTIIRNLRRASNLFLVKNVYTFLLIVANLWVFGLPFPFAPQQVTLLNYLTIGVPALLIMLRKEQSAAASRPNFLADVASFVIRTGVVTALAGLASLLVSARYLGDDEPTQRTMLLSVLVLLGAVTLWRALVDGERGMMAGDRYLRWLPALTTPVFLVVMYVPAAARFFEMTPLDLVHWVQVAGATAAGSVGMLLTDRVARRQRRNSGGDESI